MASDLYCQAKLHLGGVHFVATIYCLSFRRHLSPQHPLYDFFKYHCEGTVPHITTVFKTLTTPNAAGSVIYGTGNDLFIKQSKVAFDERNYEHFTYEHFIDVSLFSSYFLSSLSILDRHSFINQTLRDYKLEMFSADFKIALNTPI